MVVVLLVVVIVVVVAVIVMIGVDRPCMHAWCMSARDAMRSFIMYGS